tara:strand:- start:607 stop:909 length:303 start_codon:yes stop_codon:yes gene_type:complete
MSPLIPPPIFNHENKAIHNFVNLLLVDTVNMEYRSAFIMLAGIKLGNLELIKYIIATDPDSVKRRIPLYIENIIDQIFVNNPSPVSDASSSSLVDGVVPS